MVFFVCGLYCLQNNLNTALSLYLKAPHSLCLPASSFFSSFSSCPSSWNPPLYWATRFPVSRLAPPPLSAGMAAAPAPDDMTGSLECKYSSPQSDGGQREKGVWVGGYSSNFLNHHDINYNRINSVQHATLSTANVWYTVLLFVALQISSLWDPKGLQLERISGPEQMDFSPRCFEFCAGFASENVNEHTCLTELRAPAPRGCNLHFTEEPLDFLCLLQCTDACLRDLI